MSTFDLGTLAHLYKRLYGNGSGHGRVVLSDMEADALLDAMEIGGDTYVAVADEMGRQLGGEYAGSFRIERQDAIITEWNFHVGEKTVVVVAKQMKAAE